MVLRVVVGTGRGESPIFGVKFDRIELFRVLSLLRLANLVEIEIFALKKT